MELAQYWAAVGRRKGIILLTILVAMAIALLASFLLPPTYTATVTLRISSPTTGQFLSQNYDLQYADRLMNTYSKLAVSGPVLSQLQQSLGLSKPPAVSVDIPANTELMRISVEDGDPNRAAAAANMVANLLMQDFKAHYGENATNAQNALETQLAQAQNDLNQSLAKYNALSNNKSADPGQVAAAKADLDAKQQAYTNLLSQVDQARLAGATQGSTFSIVDPALPPLAPSRPNKVLNLGLGLVVGLIGGLGLAFLFENLDSTLFTSNQVEEATGAKILGRIPSVRMRRGVPTNDNFPAEEAFLRLRTNLAQLDHGVPHTLLVTSAQPAEGKSTVVVNLARALAQTGRSVVIVDADMRAPVLHRVFHLPNSRGLSTILQGKGTLDEVIQHSKIPRVFVLTSGPIPSNPSELLGSSEMAALTQQLTHLFGVVVLDTPPLLPVTDAAVLAPSVDGVLLVVSTGQARREAVQAAVDQLESIGVHSYGVVVNRSQQDPMYNSYYPRPAPEDRTRVR